ncbi:tRNA (adenosine(37)-N6)-threonylcarbamoyltransferase complex transferase subunit TsaD [Candidatus Fokinia crypta]|uniref:tRNA N6-adenosine threonylcarbamoyltransferase n=1 Tax=Candidatus Fokinia crypta TaxID=1920990 RepID=A0ABZ0UT01_9RICK|nr:tRNA (adenosine(37)-N6)-threonylcarbamoyltransferase complex transferase subunit TsaD [Candidatus Fokinia cryptica]WPX98055.1 tRNA N6-adenosine threonylcarbamoyltransferase [Candidatus Fokinia cryptica]
MIALGIESSCDDACISLVKTDGTILFNDSYSHIKLHAFYGGVVPEIASRSHTQSLPKLFIKGINESGISPLNIDFIGVTAGPGLVSSLMVGIAFAKGIATALQRPCIPINHLEAHALAPRISNKDLTFPYLLLLVSGGNTQLVLSLDIGKHIIIGETLDDAIGETFDKVAQFLKLGYPGGPLIEKMALYGEQKAYQFPKPLYRSNTLNFSFSGLKTAIKKIIYSKSEITQRDICDICASFQRTILDLLNDKISQALIHIKKHYGIQIERVVISGGVSANSFLSYNIGNFLHNLGCKLFFCKTALCTDNAAMVAWTAIEKVKNGYFLETTSQKRYDNTMNFTVLPNLRLSLDSEL